MVIRGRDILELLKTHSTTKVAKELGVSRITVWRVKVGQIPPDKKIISKKPLHSRGFNKLWKKLGDRGCYILFYVCLPNWISKKYERNSVYFQEVYDILSYTLWSLDDLLILKTNKEVFKYAKAVVNKRLWGDFRLFSNKKKEELFNKISINNISQANATSWE